MTRAVKDAWPLIAVVVAVLMFFLAAATNIIDPEAPISGGWTRVGDDQPIYHRCGPDQLGTYRNTKTRTETIVPADPRCAR